jgi:hypothetical protein
MRSHNTDNAKSGNKMKYIQRNILHPAQSRPRAKGQCLGWVDGSLRNLDDQKKRAYHCWLDPEKLITVFSESRTARNCCY